MLMQENNTIIALVASAIGSVATWMFIRIFSKSEDAAPKSYVDDELAKRDKEMANKVDKDTYNKDTSRIEGKLDQVIMLLIEKKQK